jgi:uncharacterized protein (TIGR04255 family)
MPTWENFPNAPIIEAIVDIRIEPAANASWSYSINDFSALRESHPITENQLRVSFQTEWAQDGTSSQEVSGEIKGFRFRNDHEVIQVRIDGFTFSMLPRYTDWNDLISKAWAAWEVYKSVRRDSAIVRLAVRFINRMQLPLDKPLEEFLLAAPKLSSNIRFPLRRFFTNHNIELSSDTHATIIQTIEPETSGKLPFIFDIDCYKTGSFTSESDRIRETFDALHDFKNEIFFGSVTEEAKKLWR